jgi:hypothetical protein
LDEIRPLHPENNTFPGEVFMRVAAGALWLECRTAPLASRGCPRTLAFKELLDSVEAALTSPWVRVHGILTEKGGELLDAGTLAGYPVPLFRVSL